MKETGIIMSGNHPKLILEGRKTMTRRVIKPQPNKEDYYNDKGLMVPIERARRYCPYGQVGDILRIKEAWASDKLWDGKKPSEINHLATIWYPADGMAKPMWAGRTRSARFMCNWMSRARPEIVELRVERLQEITFEDFERECIELDGSWDGTFARLWDSLFAKRGYGWEVNPWVWIINFRRI